LRPISAVAWVAALVGILSCSPSGGGSGRARLDVFSLGFFPLVLAVGGDSASLDFDDDGDLLAVVGLDRLLRVSREDGSLEETDLSGDPDCAGAALVSVLADSDTTYLGADDGRLFALDALGDCAEIADLGDEPVTGLASAPGRFELPRGTLIAAAGSDGVFSVDVSDAGAAPFERISPDPADAYIDVDFFQNLLFALDASNGELVTLVFDDASGEFERETFADDLAGAVAIAVDVLDSSMLVADAGEGALRTVDLLVADPPVVDLAPYPFDAAPPGGIAFDGTGTLAIATPGSVVLRVVRVPPLSPSNFGLFLEGPNVGFGDLEFDEEGNLLLVANLDDDVVGEERPPANFLFRLDRNGIDAQELATDLGAAGERLLGLARDPASGALFLSSDLGNVFRRDADGAITDLASLASAVLGLDWAPDASEFAGSLLASTEAGEVVALDPATGAQTPVASLGAQLPDLVFDSSGTLFVLDFETPAIWRRPDGGAFALLTDDPALGLPDGLALDEGGERLLVVSEIDAETDQLLEVTLAGDVRALLDLELDDGFFPSGVVYDGLGRVAVRSTDNGTAVDAFVVPFPL